MMKLTDIKYWEDRYLQNKIKIKNLESKK